MTIYIKNNLVNIIKDDSKKIKNLNKTLKLTKIMNELSTIFGFRNFNDLKKTIEKNNYKKNINFKNLDDLFDEEFRDLKSKYYNYISFELLPKFENIVLHYQIFSKSKIEDININKEITNDIFSKNKNDDFKIDLTNENVVFKISELEKDEIKYYCKIENIKFEGFSNLMSDNNGISLKNIKNIDKKVIFKYKKDDEKIETFIKLLLIIIKNHHNNNKEMIDTISNINSGCQIIKEKNEVNIINIINNILDYKETKKQKKLKVALFGIDKDFKNKENILFKKFKINEYKDCIRYANPNVIIFNEPNMENLYEEIYKLICIGHLVIIFTKKNYDHFEIIKRNGFFLKNLDMIHLFNTYKNF